MNAYRGTLIVIACCFVLMFASVAYMFQQLSPPTKQSKVDPLIAQSRKELVDLLGELSRVWNPEHRETLIRRAVAKKERLLPPLEWVLGFERHRYMKSALELSGRMGAPVLLVPLRRHAMDDSPELRTIAIVAAERVEPWPESILARFLEREERRIKLAALKACQGRKRVPISPILDCLASEDAELRRFALRAIPASASKALCLALTEKLGEYGASEHWKLMEALGRVERSRDVERLLVRGLVSGEGRAVTASLEALASQRTPLRDSSIVVKLILDDSRSNRDRALALSCMERTGTALPDSLTTRVADLPIGLHYHAARCLLREGKQQGLDVLFDLVERRSGLVEKGMGEGRVPGIQDAYLTASRQLLGRLLRCSSRLPLVELKIRASGLGTLEALSLPPAPKELFELE